MSSISPEISQVLAQMRVMQAQAQAEVAKPEVIAPVADSESRVSFRDLLTNSLDAVNAAEKESGKLKRAFEMGDPDVSITEVMIASEKSGIAFTAMLEVRKKMLEAYKEIMNMPV